MKCVSEFLNELKHLFPSGIQVFREMFKPAVMLVVWNGASCPLAYSLTLDRGLSFVFFPAAFIVTLCADLPAAPALTDLSSVPGAV